MAGTRSIFLDVHLPNATTWFYLAVILGVALFFRFQRFWKLRNWDLLMLFALVPPLLLLREGQMLKAEHQALWDRQGLRVSQMLLGAGEALAAPVTGGIPYAVALSQATTPPGLSAKIRGYPHRLVWIAYLWLIIGSAYWLVRCLIDLAISKRAPFVANLTVGGLAWLALALFLIMSTWTFLPRPDSAAGPQSQNLVLEKSARVISAVVQDHWTLTTPKTLEAILALVCHAFILLGLFWIGMQHFQDATTGMASVVLYLVLPYTSFELTNLEQVFPAMLVVLAVAAFRWPVLAGTFLGLACLASFFPVVILPVWCSFYWRRGLLRFLAPMAIMASFFAALLWLDPELQRGVVQALDRPEWQPWYYGEQPLAEGLWTGLSLHFAYRLPLFIGFLVLLVGSLFWPAPKNLGHLLAWSAALILGIQFWYADAGGTYVLWYLPLLVLLALKPTLADGRPPEIEPDRDWLYRSARWLRRRLNRRASMQGEAGPTVKTLALRKAG